MHDRPEPGDALLDQLEGLVEGLRTDEFDDKYGPVGSEAYNKVWKPIEERIAALPLYAEEKK